MAVMQLGRRPSPFLLQSYSLTGDLLSFMRCGLQYRYSGIGRLPASEPVQLWFGQFIHGVMEEAFRLYAADRGSGGDGSVAWREDAIADMIDLVERRLAAQGLRAWEEQGQRLGHQRAFTALTVLGPDLFPLIHRAEVRLTGARRLLAPPPGTPERYEVAGVVDVLTHVEAGAPGMSGNRLVEALVEGLGGALPEQFEAIIDYKGSRRPGASADQRTGLAEVYAWQVQTYAHLRGLQEGSLPVVAGVVLYLNELLPSSGDIDRLRAELREGRADVPPPPDSEAARLLASRGDATGERLPLDYRLARAIRVYPVTTESMNAALASFDHVVTRIERCRLSEQSGGGIVGSWERNDEDAGTCAACDARTFCPSFRRESEPALPGYAARV